MTQHADVMRQALETLDVGVLRRLWAEVSPHLPQPGEADALATAHMARTQMDALPRRLRFYSHRWLVERGLPSQLPDRMRASAERMYPVRVGAVGISVSAPAHRADLAREVRTSMEYAVQDCYANGDTDPTIVRPRMLEARRNAYKR
jgi:hypothetical protein